MLDMRFVRENIDAVRENIANRGVSVDLDALIELDAGRLVLLKEAEALHKERNEVAEAMKSATPDTRAGLIERGKKLKEDVVAKEKDLEVVEKAWREELLKLPNMTHPDAPVGKTDEDNKAIDTVGKINKLENP